MIWPNHEMKPFFEDVGVDLICDCGAGYEEQGKEEPAWEC